MTKADLIEGLSNKLGMNKGEAEKAVNIMLDDIITAPKRGGGGKILGLRPLWGPRGGGAHRAQSQDRGIDRDFGEPIGEVQARQAA